MKILAVEDQPVSRLALVGALKALGHEVLQAADGDAAWKILETDHAVRVVVCDWRLPKLDGLSLCRRVRKKREDYVSFILLTQERPTRENLKDAFSSGVDDFLSKPVNSHELELCLHVASRILNFTSEIKVLEDFLPICAFCKKIRDDQDYWRGIENYLGDHAGTHISHSVCPDCAKKEPA